MYQIYAEFDGKTYSFGNDPNRERAFDRRDRIAGRYTDISIKVDEANNVSADGDATDLDFAYNKPVAVLKASSHRARNRLYNAIRHNGPTQAVYHLKDGNHYGAYRVNAEQLAAAKGVKGVTKARKPVAEWCFCIS